ncbi:imm11 family protein [Flavobacterium collinsii]|uniref:imm11 family protein n=1 Tax=Flavobacterium collinsii TaxID=1114861 RepID=UPI003756BAEB
MRYYKFTISLSNDDGRISSSASVDKIPNIENLFEKIRYGEIMENFPIIDSFYLESYDEEKYWENQKNDIHTLIGKVNILIGWYVSEDLKSLLENFKIAPKYNFYETILLYKGSKFKYWIFQFPIDQFEIIDFQKSKFSLDGEYTLYNFSSKEDYLSFYRTEYRSTKRKLKIVQQVLVDSYDIFATTNNDKVMSEKLKNSIEKMGLTGFEFSEVDYEIVVEKS